MLMSIMHYEHINKTLNYIYKALLNFYMRLCGVVVNAFTLHTNYPWFETRGDTNIASGGHRLVYPVLVLSQDK